MTIKCPNPLCAYENEDGLSKCKLCGASLPRINISPVVDMVEPQSPLITKLIGIVKVISTDQEYPPEDPEKERRLQFYIQMIEVIPHLFGSSIFITILFLLLFPVVLIQLINVGVFELIKSPLSLLIFIGIIFYIYIASNKGNSFDFSGILSKFFDIVWRLINGLARGLRGIIGEILQGSKRHFQDELNTLRNKRHGHPTPIRNIRIIEKDNQTEHSIQIKGQLNTSDVQVGDQIQADGKYDNDGVFIPVSLKNLGTGVMIWSQKNES